MDANAEAGGAPFTEILNEVGSVCCERVGFVPEVVEVVGHGGGVECGDETALWGECGVFVAVEGGEEVFVAVVEVVETAADAGDAVVDAEG